MAKAKKKRSAARARAKRRPCEAPPQQLRLSPEALEKFRPRLPESEPDYSRLDRAIAHMSGITGSPPPAAETTSVSGHFRRFGRPARRQQMRSQERSPRPRARARPRPQIDGSPSPAAELRATIKDRATATALQMKAAGEIPERVLKKPFAERLARRIGEPEKWNYIRNNMAEWGVWPIAEIKPPKGHA